MPAFTPFQLARLRPLFATAEQGALADAAATTGDPISQFVNNVGYLVPGNNVSLLTNNAGYLVPGNNVSLLTNNAGYLKSGDNVSALANDAGYVPAFHVITHEEVVTGTVVTLANVPKSWYQPQVFVNGSLQPAANYTIVGAVVTSTVPLVAATVQIVYAY